MNVVFRVDASQKIGAGHLMRCLTLAEELRKKSSKITFIARDHVGNLNYLIEEKGFNLCVLPVRQDELQKLGCHEELLSTTQQIDAEDTVEVIENEQIEWLVIDHYALDRKWAKKLRPYVEKIMVIDDLANREYDCDLLLDQNYVNDKNRYDQFVKLNTVKLLGPKYALLRENFVEYHNYSCCAKEKINKVFVFFGGSDLYNLTITSLKALSQPGLSHLSVDVVIGFANINHTEIEEYIADNMNIKLYVQVDNIAEIMADADISLGAGGSTTWERMAVGLPSLVVTLAENQVAFTKELHKKEYINWIGHVDQVNQQTIYGSLLRVIDEVQELYEQSHRGKLLVDGLGVNRVVNEMINYG